MFNLLAFATVLALAATAQAGPPPGAAQRAVADATGAALQADAARALAVLRPVSPADLDPADRAFRSCMLDRFGAAPGRASPVPEAANPEARAIFSAYRHYWRSSLLNPSRRAHYEAQLHRSLRRALGNPAAPDMDAIEPLLRERLRRAGYFSLQGRTGSLRELMVWAKEQTRDYDVQLPEARHVTRVHLLDDFVSLGWGDFATCGRRGAGGWATSNALYAVVPRYRSLEGEEFRVTFLGHETQHFADLARFPDLAPWELEYRAKLVELAQARETIGRVLLKFTEDQGDDPSSPHSYANKRVLRAVTRRLGLPDGSDLRAVDIARLNEAAAEELRANRPRSVTPAQERGEAGAQHVRRT